MSDISFKYKISNYKSFNESINFQFNQLSNIIVSLDISRIDKEQFSHVDLRLLKKLEYILLLNIYGENKTSDLKDDSFIEKYYSKVKTEFTDLIYPDFITYQYLNREIEHEDNLKSTKEYFTLFLKIYNYEKNLSSYQSCSIDPMGIYSDSFVDETQQFMENIKLIKLDKNFNHLYDKAISNIYNDYKFIDDKNSNNNLFIAIDEYVNSPKATISFNEYMKLKLSDYIQNNHDEYLSILKDYFNFSINSYVNNIEKNKKNPDISFYIKHLNKLFSNIMSKIKVEQIKSVGFVYRYITEKYTCERTNHTFIAAGEYYSHNNQIHYNLKSNHKFPKGLRNLQIHENVMYHEFGHAVHEHIKKYKNSYNEIEHLNVVKKSYKILTKLNANNRYQHYLKYDSHSYICKPEFRHDKIYYKRALEESIAESIAIIFTLYNFDIKEFRLFFVSTMGLNAIYEIKYLYPCILYFIDNIGLEELGLSSHNHAKKVLFIKQFVLHVINEPSKPVKRVILNEFKRSALMPILSYISKIKTTNIKKNKNFKKIS